MSSQKTINLFPNRRHLHSARSKEVCVFSSEWLRRNEMKGGLGTVDNVFSFLMAMRMLYRTPIHCFYSFLSRPNGLSLCAIESLYWKNCTSFLKDLRAHLISLAKNGATKSPDEVANSILEWLEPHEAVFKCKWCEGQKIFKRDNQLFGNWRP